MNDPNAAHIEAEPIITISNLVKQFGRFAALRGVSASFSPGRLYGILGDNGAGKTTLLRGLAGLAQHPSLLYDEMSGLENLRYFAQLYGLEDDARCANSIAAVGLDPELGRPVGQYSQGMRQRMSLARALLNDPKILLLDEPFSNVDIRSAREMVKLLAGIRDGGKTIFVVTHQASLLDGAANEFIWMDQGQIINRTPDLTFRETA